jgi:polyisoprenoid-binding protein YceI
MTRALCLAALVLFPAIAAAASKVVYDQSEIAFSVKQMGVPVSGRFAQFTADIDLEVAHPEKGSAQISVDIASITTGMEEGDDTARDKAWLDADGFPKATFKSSAVRGLGGARYEAKGTLTIRGKARELTVPFTLKRDGATTIVAGDFSIRRTDFGIGGGEWNESDLVANEVPIHFRLTLKETP